jgi:hypothetical protein
MGAGAGTLGTISLLLPWKKTMVLDLFDCFNPEEIE